MSSLLYSLTKQVIRFRYLVILIWIVALSGTIFAWHTFAGPTDQSITIPGTPSQVALDKLKNVFPQMGNTSAYIVIEDQANNLPVKTEEKSSSEPSPSTSSIGETSSSTTSPGSSSSSPSNSSSQSSSDSSSSPSPSDSSSPSSSLQSPSNFNSSPSSNSSSASPLSSPSNSSSQSSPDSSSSPSNSSLSPSSSGSNSSPSPSTSSSSSPSYPHQNSGGPPASGDKQSSDLTEFENEVLTAGSDLKNISQVLAIQTAYGQGSEYSDKLLSTDESATIIQVQFDTSWSSVTKKTKDQLEHVKNQLSANLGKDYKVFLGGELYAVEMPSISYREFIGVGVALLILIYVLGTALAAFLPLLTALFAVGIGLLSVLASSSFIQILSFTPMLGLMLGTAVSIDYAFFIISKHVAGLKEGLGVKESLARATATAGSAVIFAGLTVILGVVGLIITGIPFLGTLGLVAAWAIIFAVLVAITLLPAILSLLGTRVMRRRDRKALGLLPIKKSKQNSRVDLSYINSSAVGDKLPDGKSTAFNIDSFVDNSSVFSSASNSDKPEVKELKSKLVFQKFFKGWVSASTRFAPVTIALIVILCGSMILPALKVNLIVPDAHEYPLTNEARQTYDVVAKHFGEGFNGPLIVMGSIIHSQDPEGLVSKIADKLAGLSDVAGIRLATPNVSVDTGVIVLIPKSAPDSPQTTALVHRLRDMHDELLKDFDFDSEVTSKTAVSIDISKKLNDAILPFGIFVVGLCLLLLILAFRSIWVPVFAAIGFLLSFATSLGAVSLIYTYGFGASIVGATTGGIVCFAPIIIMGILFGLAMDYEMFLVSTIREEFVRTKDARLAIKLGFEHSGKVVLAVSLIMASVFASFIFSESTDLKPIAIALTVGVLVDALIVRMTLMPALLHVLGSKAWWLPKILAKSLPNVDIEGEQVIKEIGLQNWGLEQGVCIMDGDLKVLDGQTRYITGLSPDETYALTAYIAGSNGVVVRDKMRVLSFLLPMRASKVRKKTVFIDVQKSGWIDDFAAVAKKKYQLLVISDIACLQSPQKEQLTKIISDIKNLRLPELTVIIGDSSDYSAKSTKFARSRVKR